MFIANGFSSTGFECESNMDYITTKSLSDDLILLCIADGNCSRLSTLHPAFIACDCVTNFIERVYDKGANTDLIIEHGDVFLREAMMSANNILGAFHTANEDVFPAFSCSMTCALFSSYHDVLKFSFAHNGNTRLYMIKKSNDGTPVIKQITKDQTEAQLLLAEEKISSEDYYFHDGRMRLLCPLGVRSSPRIDSLNSTFRKDQIFLLTTDGIHYAIREEFILDFILKSNTLEDACATLSNASNELKYHDNSSSILLSYTDKE